MSSTLRTPVGLTSIPPQGPGRFSFSTDLVPERDRVGFFREELAKVLGLDVELLDDKPPKYQIDSILAGPIAINMVRGSPTRVSRTKAKLADSDDGFMFVLHTAHRREIKHNGRETALEPGDACLVQNSRASIGTYPDGGSAIAVRIEGTALRALVRQPEALAGDRISHDHPGVSLLRGYLRSYSQASGLAPDLLRTFGFHVIDIVVSILGTSRDGAAQAEAGGVRAARLRQVLDAIATRAFRPDFNVEAVATELRVTSRTIQMLLEETGSTFSEHVMEHRLRRAWRLLSDRQCSMKIAEIAFETGFNDLSHFYRTFRRRFGETPAAVRASGNVLH
jgi:AraC-like DNA-binding protein